MAFKVLQKRFEAESAKSSRICKMFSKESEPENVHRNHSKLIKRQYIHIGFEWEKRLAFINDNLQTTPTFSAITSAGAWKIFSNISMWFSRDQTLVFGQKTPHDRKKTRKNNKFLAVTNHLKTFVAWLETICQFEIHFQNYVIAVFEPFRRHLLAALFGRGTGFSLRLRQKERSNLTIPLLISQPSEKSGITIFFAHMFEKKICLRNHRTGKDCSKHQSTSLIWSNPLGVRFEWLDHHPPPFRQGGEALEDPGGTNGKIDGNERK